MSKDYGCPKCGSMDVFIEEKGSQNGLYCSEGCGWIKWVSKKDLPYVREQIEDNKKIKAEAYTVDLNNYKTLEEHKRYGVMTLMDCIKQKRVELEIDNNAYNRGFVKGLEMAMKIMEVK